MLLSRLIYCSQPFGYDQPMLNGILADARTYNPKNDITGALICREDIFLQLLEGPEDRILFTYNKIINDGTAKIVSQTEGLKCIFNFLFQYLIYSLQLLYIDLESNSV